MDDLPLLVDILIRIWLTDMGLAYVLLDLPHRYVCLGNDSRIRIRGKERGGIVWIVKLLVGQGFSL